MDNQYEAINGQSTSELTILKNKHIENIYKIEIKNASQPLLTNLKKTGLLTGSSINTFFTEISFQANSVSTLQEYIQKNNWTYKNTLELVYSLTKQLEFLNKNGYSFYGYDIGSILVINKSLFFQISTEYLVPTIHDTITFYLPFSKKIFISPEMYKITTLPQTISFKTIYYSLSRLCIYLLFKKNIIEKHTLDPIQDTKLYWFLIRALEKRKLLYL